VVSGSGFQNRQSREKDTSNLVCVSGKSGENILTSPSNFWIRWSKNLEYGGENERRHIKVITIVMYAQEERRTCPAPRSNFGE
jgi:hypothetical protein